MLITTYDATVDAFYIAVSNELPDRQEDFGHGVVADYSGETLVGVEIIGGGDDTERIVHQLLGDTPTDLWIMARDQRVVAWSPGLGTVTSHQPVKRLVLS